MPELKLPFFGHGGDYNPDQWRDRPDILEEDIRLMKLAGCNLMSVGIFAWSALEPQEGRFDFDWLEDVLDRFAENGISAFLATPSGARPAWMSERYPEVLRVREDGQRNLHGGRHNHCFTSPVYREFVRRINAALAGRFGHHPAVVGWHVSNEYGGACHCELCQEAFRTFLKEAYGSLDALNRAWWTGFWSKTYTDWRQLHSPSRFGEATLHGLNLSWKRFVTHQTVDFMRAEVAPLRAVAPNLPVTTNLMTLYDGLDPFRFASVVDFASYDSYPRWGADDASEAALAAMNYDIMRCILRRPFALMESTPSQVNWQDVCKLKKPGMHLLSSLHAVAHGADTVQYFQWRKSRGASEKFHGAVVDHVGHEHTRTFRDVAEVGRTLPKLSGVLGAPTPAHAALVFDWENRWALEDSQGPRREKHYEDTVLEHYRALRRCGMDVDVIEEGADLSGYALVAAPMLYMVKPGVAEALESFVRGGGTFVATCHTGCVDRDDLCFLGGFPGPLRRLLGVWIEETDALYDGETNGICAEDGQTYACSTLCDLIHAETARVTGTYAADFYAGTPAVTVNAFGAGRAHYIATRPGLDFLTAFYRRRLAEAGVEPLCADLPDGVEVSSRASASGRYLFAMNFSGKPARIRLPVGTDMLTGEAAGGDTALGVNGIAVIRVDAAGT